MMHALQRFFCKKLPGTLLAAFVSEKEKAGISCGDASEIQKEEEGKWLLHDKSAALFSPCEMCSVCLLKCFCTCMCVFMCGHCSRGRQFPIHIWQLVRRGWKLEFNVLWLTCTLVTS